jgi:hypothetical protein
MKAQKPEGPIFLGQPKAPKNKRHLAVNLKKLPKAPRHLAMSFQILKQEHERRKKGAKPAQIY